MDGVLPKTGLDQVDVGEDVPDCEEERETQYQVIGSKPSVYFSSP